MERRALLAVAISVLILVLYQELIVKQYYPPPSETGPAEVADIRPESESPGEPPLEELPVALPLAPDVKPEPEPAALDIAPEGRDVVVETDLYRAVFSTAGARLKGFFLKKYRTAVEADSPPLDLLGASATGRLPLGLTLRGQDDQVRDAGVEYTVDHETLELSEGETGSLTFSGELAGTTITKHIDFIGDSYFIGVHLGAKNVNPAHSELAISWSNPHLAEPNRREEIFESIVALEADKLRHEKLVDLQESKVFENQLEWIAYSGKYFLAAIVPGNEGANGTPMGGFRAWSQQHGDAIEAFLVLPSGVFDARLDLYLGPKELTRLEGHSLRRAVDLGWFSFIALPLLQVLRMCHKISGNYGVDIILLTILIKILFFPLTQKSFKSMKDMQKLQPQMTKIREQLKDKPDEMNKEIMELYRRNKVNPLGGCLPMLLQMPVFIGLYQALLNTVELRHAPFMGWINDLSAPDRLGSLQIPFVEPAGVPVLTLFMGGSMLVQQWMTPMTTGDPMQQRMMMLMPLIFTFMFINFPSGLTLYWLVNNILTIAQQYLINRPAAAR